MSATNKPRVLAWEIYSDPFASIRVFDENGDCMCTLPVCDNVEDAIYEWLLDNGHIVSDYRVLPLMYCPKCGEHSAVTTGKDYLVEFDEDYDDESIVEHECQVCGFGFYIPAIN